MVFPKPTSSAKITPFDKGFLQANKAASTYAGLNRLGHQPMLLLTSPYCRPRLDELKAKSSIWIDEVLDDVDTYIYDAPNVFF